MKKVGILIIIIYFTSLDNLSLVYSLQSIMNVFLENFHVAFQLKVSEFAEHLDKELANFTVDYFVNQH